MIVIQAPEKCKDYYVSRIFRGKNNQRLKIRLPETKLLDIRAADDNAYILKLWIPPDSIACEVMEDTDDKAILTTSEHNKEWFANGLSAGKINEYFRRSIDNQVCNVIVSPIKVPRSIIINGETIDDFDKVAAIPTRELKSFVHCSCTIEAQGLYFYPKRFGVRWLLTEIEMGTDDQIHDSMEDHGNPDRIDIEEFWDMEVQEVRTLIREDMNSLYARIDQLAAIKKELMETLESAKSEKECSVSWEEKLDSLKRRIFNYKSGRL